jgi:CheY-like chemotaxis protein
VIKLGFHIVDTGIGISEDRIERLFEPFLAAGNTSARKYTGNGMGLFIARRLINLMGGKVKVDSKPGQGTTFSFYIMVRSGVAEGANTKNKVSRPIPTPVENAEPSVRTATTLPTITNYVTETVIPNITETPSITTDPTKDAPLTQVFNEAINPANEVAEIVKTPEVENVISEPINTDFSMLNTTSEAAGDTAIPEVNSFIDTTVEPIVEHAKIPTITKLMGEEEIVENAPPVLNILAVDDNEINLMLISKSLQKIGYECKKATNGEQAVEMVKKEKFDLIFMDMQMPIMDGTDATTEIRKHYRIFEYPVVIALTANAIGDGREKCLESGMQDFITKPFKPAQIEEIIREWAPKIEVYREKFSDIAP